MTKHFPTPTQAQIDALREYADTHGRAWKAKLNHDWMTGQARAELQQVRNEFGPSWLVKFNLKKYAPDIVATGDPEHPLRAVRS